MFLLDSWVFLFVEFRTGQLPTHPGFSQNCRYSDHILAEFFFSMIFCVLARSAQRAGGPEREAKA